MESFFSPLNFLILVNLLGMSDEAIEKGAFQMGRGRLLIPEQAEHKSISQRKLLFDNSGKRELLTEIKQLTDQFEKYAKEMKDMRGEFKELTTKLRTDHQLKTDLRIVNIERQVNKIAQLNYNAKEDSAVKDTVKFSTKTESCPSPSPTQMLQNVTKVKANNPILRKLLAENNRLKEDKSELKSKINEMEKGASWLRSNLENKTFTSELFLSIEDKEEGAMHFLVELGATINVKNNLSETPLHRSSVGDDKTVCLRMIKYLIEKGANIYAMDNGNRTFLHNLVSDDTTLTPSLFADISTYLIHKRLSDLFNIPGWGTGATPLLAAVGEMEVESETLKLLHKNGADFQAVNSNGATIWTYALWGKRSTKLMSILPELGVDPKQLDDNNSTLLHIAAESGHAEGVTYLLKLGLGINTPNSYGNTPLHYVAMFGKGQILETVRTLIENGADLKIENYMGRTPLQEGMQRETMFDRNEVIGLLNNGSFVEAEATTSKYVVKKY